MLRFNVTKLLPLLAIAGVMAIAVAACSGEDAPEPTPAQAAAEATSDEAMMDKDDGESMEAESDDAMMDKDDDESMEAKSDEAMMDKDDDESMEAKSDEAMTDKDDGETMEAKSNEAMMDKDDESMEAKSDEAMMDKDDGESMEAKSDEAMMSKTLPDRIVAPHFVDSIPAHGDTLTQAPERVVLDFNFNLQPESRITVTRDGEEVPVMSREIADDKLSMRVSLDGAMSGGVYQVDYSACWPDGSCHQGTIGFIVDSAS